MVRKTDPNVLELVDKVLERFTWITKEQRLLASLWTLHTHVFEGFDLTPRLALLSPTYGCGKSRLLWIIEQLSYRPAYYVNISPALIYRLIGDTGTRTLLLDEGDNLNLQDKTLRAVLNANEPGMKLGRADKQEGIVDYNTFTPVAVAAVGKLPNALIQRSVVINMDRYPSNKSPLERMNKLDAALLAEMGAIRTKIITWAKESNLNATPPNPLTNRGADNWRVLFAIADNLGCGTEAREAAIKLCSGLPDEDPKVFLLEDIRTVFGELGVDRIFTAQLLEELHKLELWGGWIGVNSNLQPHQVTDREVAVMLHAFGIRPRTVSPLGSRQSRGPSGRGYFRKDFERAWASYCTPAAPTHQRTSS